MSTPAPTIAARASSTQATARHELFFFNYFRLGQAAVYTALAFRPEHMNWPALPEPVFARVLALAYLFAALVMVARTRHTLHRPVLTVSIGLTLDIAAALLALVLMHDVRMGVAMMLAVNIATGALLLPFRLSMFFAALATLGMLGHSLFDLDDAASSTANWSNTRCSARPISPAPRCVTCWGATSARRKPWPSSAVSTWPTCPRSTN